VVGGEGEGVRCSGGEVVVPREVRCPDDDVGAWLRLMGQVPDRLPDSDCNGQGRRGGRQVNSN
jgi:hypothetical protein